MGLKKLFLITVLAGAMSVLGCGDDDGNGNGNGGMIDPGVRCNESLCLTDPAKKTECETKVQECIDNNPPIQQEECVIGIVAAVCGV
jgi:hypothetical protein